MADHSDLSRLVSFLARVALKTAIVLAIPLFATIAYVVCLRRAGELLPASTIADMSLATDRMIWLSGYYDTGLLQKTDVARRVQPRVAVVGSSRVLQLRAEFFDKVSPGSFYNVGGCCQSVQEAQRTIHGLLKTARPPKLVLLGVDPWWFSSRSPTPNAIRTAIPPSAVASARAGQAWWSNLADRTQLLQRAWRDERFQRIARAGFPPERDNATNARLVGVLARVSHGGYRNDGSFHYGGLIDTTARWLADSATPDRLPRFTTATAADIASKGLEQERYVERTNVSMLDEILAQLHAAGIAVIVFVPPVAPTAWRILETTPGSREFISAFASVLSELGNRRGVAIVNALDPGTLAASDEDFYDWPHPSERAAAQLMMSMYADPRTATLLEPYGDAGHLARDMDASPRRRYLFDY